MSQEQEMSSHLDLLMDLAITHGYDIRGQQTLVSFFREYLEKSAELSLIADTMVNYGFDLKKKSPKLYEFIAGKLRQLQGMITDRANSGVISVTEETWLRIGRQVDEVVTRALKAEAQVKELREKLEESEKMLSEMVEDRHKAWEANRKVTDLAEKYGFSILQVGPDAIEFLTDLLKSQTNSIQELERSQKKTMGELGHLQRSLVKIKNVIKVAEEHSEHPLKPIVLQSEGNTRDLMPEEYERSKRQAEFPEATTKPPAKVWTSADLFLEEVTKMWQDENSNKPFRAPSPKDLLDWIRENASVAEQMPAIVQVAKEAGWDGVNNSKIFSFFLAGALRKKGQPLEYDLKKKHYYYACPTKGCCGTFPVPAVADMEVVKCQHCKKDYLVDTFSVTPAERREKCPTKGCGENLIVDDGAGYVTCPKCKRDHIVRREVVE